jgi:hypothetical protein
MRRCTRTDLQKNYRADTCFRLDASKFHRGILNSHGTFQSRRRHLLATRNRRERLSEPIFESKALPQTVSQTRYLIRKQPNVWNRITSNALGLQVRLNQSFQTRTSAFDALSHRKATRLRASNHRCLEWLRTFWIAKKFSRC